MWNLKRTQRIKVATLKHKSNHVDVSSRENIVV